MNTRSMATTGTSQESSTNTPGMMAKLRAGQLKVQEDMYSYGKFPGIVGPRKYEAESIF